MMADNPFAQFVMAPQVGSTPPNPFAQFGGGDVGRFAAPGAAGLQIPPVDTAVDVAKSAVSGLGKGAIGLATLPGNIEALGRAGINAAAKWYRGNDENVVNPDTVLTNASDLQPRVEKYTGEFYKPKTTAGKYAGTIAEFAPAALIPGGQAGIASKVLGNVVAPAVVSETAGQLTEGTKAEPWARAAGAFVGPRAVSPAAIKDPVRAAAVKTLNQEGVSAITAGQATGRAPLRWTEAALADAPFVGKAQKINEKAASQFTAAALKRAGINATRATDDVIDGAFTRLGAEFDKVGQIAKVRVTPRMAARVAQIENRYTNTTQPSLTSRLPEAIANDIKALGQNQFMDGTAYLRWRSQLGEAARGASDPGTRRALYDLQKVLDDGAEAYLRSIGRSIRQSGLVDDFRKARREYRNLIVVTDAISGAGEKTALGFISPAQLRSAAQRMEGKQQFARGRGDFTKLAKAGTAIMSPLPQSGTAPRAAVASGLAAIGGTFAGAPGALSSIAAPAIAGNVLMSSPVQSILRNQAAPQTMDQLARNPALMAVILSQMQQSNDPRNQ